MRLGRLIGGGSRSADPHFRRWGRRLEGGPLAPGVGAIPHWPNGRPPAIPGAYRTDRTRSAHSGLHQTLALRVPAFCSAGEAVKPLAPAPPSQEPTLNGEAAEGSKAPDSKCGAPLRVPRVRIPPFPPQAQINQIFTRIRTSRAEHTPESRRHT
jgi:hypothetical protein